jgi:Ankyrin repeats (3 copies)/Ankyrin repeats (many copies)
MFAALATQTELGVFARYSSNSDETLKPVTNEELISLCPTLLEIRRGGQVAFQNEGLRSVIRSPWSRKLGFGSAGAVHESIAAVCFRHLACISKETILYPWTKTGAMLGGETKQCHFRSYCTNYWQDHYRAAETSSRKLVAMLHSTLEEAFGAASASWRPEEKSPISWLSTGIWICSVWDLKILGRTYLEMGAEVDRCSGSTEAPLHVAAANSSMHMLQLLLDRGASPKLRDKYGCTALQQACRAGALDVVALLLQNGADLGFMQHKAEDAFTHTISFSPTPLHLASDCGHSEIVKVLLEAGCSQKAPPAVCGWTALHLAVNSGSEDAVRFLVDWGADIEAESASFETALKIAIRWRHDSIARYLVYKGAKRAFCTAQDELYLDRVLAGESLPLTLHHFQSMSFESGDVSMNETAPVKNSRSSFSSCAGFDQSVESGSEYDCDWTFIDRMEIEV